MDDVIKTSAATSVDAFEPSLWHYIGQFQARYALTALVDQVANDRMAGRRADYPVVLLTGTNGSGRRTLARSLHLAFGNLDFKEPALTLGTNETVADFFGESTEHTTFYIPNFTKLSVPAASQLISAIRDGICYKYFFFSKDKETIYVGNRLIILSTERDNPIAPDILKLVSVRCDLSRNTKLQIMDILQQRAAFLNWRVSEETLDLIAHNSQHNPGRAIKMLQNSYMVMRANTMDGNVIDITHTKKALASQV